MFLKPFIHLQLLCLATVLQAYPTIQSFPPAQSRAWDEPVATGEPTVRREASSLAHHEQLHLSGEGGDLEPGATERPRVPRGGTTATSAAPETSPTVIQQWHALELDFEGPTVSERGHPNPFTDYRLDVVFAHKDGRYKVRGFFAADGNAANTGAESGNVWRVRFTPRHVGRWPYTATLKRGKAAAVGAGYQRAG